MMKIMDKVCEKLGSEKVAAEHLGQIVEFIQVFADKCHHGKEEGLLFPAIEETGIPRDGGPTGAMLEEHEIGRSYVKAMKEAAENYKNGDAEAAAKFAENARNYIRLLTEHIDKEDNILYEIADMHLSEEKQKELLCEFEKVENEKIGAGKHEEFHKLLERLKETYAVS